MTDEPTDEALENLFVEETGFDVDDFPAAIFDFARAVLAKWGQPAQAAEPVALEPLSAAQKQHIHNETGAGHALICLVESYLLEMHHGIKGGQHGAE